MATTLYQRLGGANGIARLVDDVIAAHLINPVVKTRFENIKDLDHAKDMARQFFSAGSGGPETYTGKDMRTAHKGMNISEQEYLAVMDDIVGVMGETWTERGHEEGRDCDSVFTQGRDHPRIMSQVVVSRV